MDSWLGFFMTLIIFGKLTEKTLIKVKSILQRAQAYAKELLQNGWI